MDKHWVDSLPDGHAADIRMGGFPIDGVTLATMNPARAAQAIAEFMGLEVDHDEIERWAKYADEPDE